MLANNNSTVTHLTKLFKLKKSCYLSCPENTIVWLLFACISQAIKTVVYFVCSVRLRSL